MTNGKFVAGGAIRKDDFEIYVERQSDLELLTYVYKMNYLMVVEPRQQGKTSLINRLQGNLSDENYFLIFIDISTLDYSSEENWYETFYDRLISQLKHCSLSRVPLIIPKNSFQCRKFFYEVAEEAKNKSINVVIALDEIGAKSFSGLSDFFIVLREIFNSRQVEPVFNYLTFILVGAFHPRDLIKDDMISPFNVAKRIRVPDFNLEHVQRLVSIGRWTINKSLALARRIYYWTDGQPYLTQLLCSFLDIEPKVKDVDIGVERLRKEDENHLSPLLRRLESDPDLMKYMSEIYKGAQYAFFPGELKKQAKLELLGVIKADKKGFCKIRNRIYVKALENLYIQTETDEKLTQKKIDTQSQQSDEQTSAPQTAHFYLHAENIQGLVVGDQTKVKQEFRAVKDDQDKTP